MMSANANGSSPVEEKGSLVDPEQCSVHDEKAKNIGQKPSTTPPKGSDPDDPGYTGWNLGTDGDKFKFAPPPSESNPWTVLLEPLLEKDRIQCEAWKNEVNNVLFFATLFSAVVTAFVIESYKSLQDDPQVVLLAHIAISLDTVLNGTSSSTITSLAGGSGPPSADIRINSFWFMSLVLSLTTVLFGIISLQWLGEHQGYSELTPKQAFAVFQMRKDGIEKWYLPKVFTALPVLLQGAVVLFLVGMIDFSLLLGNKVSIPTVIAIGSTLLFYIATTVLPTVQGLIFYIPFLLSNQPLTAPPQCPYKSPQSRAFRIVFHFTFHIAYLCYLHIIEPVIRLAVYRVPRLLGHIPSIPDPEDDPIIPLLSTTWGRRTWQEFDLAWISLRDNYALQRFNRQGLIEHLRVPQKLMPVFDSITGLRSLFRGSNTEIKDDYLSTIYHCFCDVSRSVTDHVVHTFDNSFLDQTGYHHHYFYSLIDDRYTDHPRLSEYLLVHPNRTFDTPNFIDPEWMMLHHEHIVLFFSNVLVDLREFRSFRLHLVEVETRAMKWIYDKRTEIVPSTLLVLTKMPMVTPLSIAGIVCNHTRDDDIQRAHELWWQYANIYLMFFEYAGSDRAQSLKRDIHAGCHIPNFILQMEIDLSYLRGFNYDKTINQMSDRTLESMLTIIQDRLEEFLDHPTPIVGHRPDRNLLFYTAALFLRRFNISRMQYARNYQDLPKDVDAVVATLARYKRTVLDVNGRDAMLEQRFAGIEKYDGVIRFSPAWWKFLDNLSSKPRELAAQVVQTDLSKLEAGWKDETISIDTNKPPSDAQ